MTNNLKNIWKLVFAVMFGIASWSLLMPATVIALSEANYTAKQIGFFAALPFVTMLVTTFFLTHIKNYFGLKRAYYLAMGLITISTAGFVYTSNYFVWCFYNFLSGFSASILWVITESYIAEKAPKDKKGKYIGIFETLMGTAYSSGPFIAKLFDFNATEAIEIAFYLRIFSWLPLFLVNFGVSETKRKKLFKAIFSKSLVKEYSFLIFAALLAGFFESGTLAMASLYTLILHYSNNTALMAGGVIGFGSLLMQYPLGVISDKTSPVKILNICFIMILISCVLIFLAPQFRFFIWPAMFIWGAFGGGLYTIAMILVGKNSKKSNILRGTVYLVIFYNLGALIAPSLGGIATDISKLYGFSIILTIFTIVVYSLFLEELMSRKKELS
jgi:MFS family permease